MLCQPGRPKIVKFVVWRLRYLQNARRSTVQFFNEFYAIYAVSLPFMTLTFGL